MKIQLTSTPYSSLNQKSLLLPTSPKTLHLERLVRVRRHVDPGQQSFALQRRLDALQRPGAERRERDRMAGETGVGVEFDEGLVAAPVFRLQRDPVAGEGAVVGFVLDRVDEGEALEEAAVGLGGVGDQLWRGLGSGGRV